jgi:hypothetical protein
MIISLEELYRFFGGGSVGFISSDDVVRHVDSELAPAWRSGVEELWMREL